MRAQRLDELVAELARRTAITRDEAGIQRLGALELAEPGGDPP